MPPLKWCRLKLARSLHLFLVILTQWKLWRLAMLLARVHFSLPPAAWMELYRFGMPNRWTSDVLSRSTLRKAVL
eukprot:symbB.v1.2.005760.t1/scaffold289.1/size287290/5